MISTCLIQLKLSDRKNTLAARVYMVFLQPLTVNSITESDCFLLIVICVRTSYAKIKLTYLFTYFHARAVFSISLVGQWDTYHILFKDSYL